MPISRILYQITILEKSTAFCIIFGARIIHYELLHMLFTFSTRICQSFNSRYKDISTHIKQKLLNCYLRVWECLKVYCLGKVLLNLNFSETAKETQMYRTVFWTLWERVGWFGKMALKHVQYHIRNDLPV